MTKGKSKGKLHNKKHMKKAHKIMTPGVTGYISRSKVTKKLQLNYNQFKQMCIFKGIHPVEPGLKRLKKHSVKTWYYLKDVNFMNRDEVVKWFRDRHIYDKKKASLKVQKKKEELAALKKRKPTLNMDHFVLERYPTLQDAVNDLDDALSIMYLFAEFDTNDRIGKVISQKHLKDAVRLKAEWQRYIVEAHALRKVFVSIKGIYYQAEVMGSPVTWLAPHQQKLKIPQGVDVRTMSFFAQFYVAMLSFVFYRLYTDLGYHYPPQLDILRLNEDELLRAVQVEKIQGFKPAAPVVHPKEEKSLTTAEKERIAIVKRSLSHIINVDEESALKKEEEGLVEIKTEPTDDAGIPDEFKTEEAAGTDDVTKVEYENDTSNLFRGLVFFINREIPRTHLQFMIHACGGDSITEYSGTVEDPRITHHIVDRAWDSAQSLVTREYIQPQWIFDSINSGILLPYHEYSATATLPPHLSPFINDVEKGYVPKQREHLDELIAQSKGEEVGQKLVKELKVVKEETDSENDQYLGEDDEDEKELSAWEAQYIKELQAEQEGRSYAGYADDEEGRSRMQFEDSEEEEEFHKAARLKEKEAKMKKAKKEEDMREMMATDMLGYNQRRQLKMLKSKQDRIALRNIRLEKRRLLAERVKKEQADQKHKALPEMVDEPLQVDEKPKKKVDDEEEEVQARKPRAKKNKRKTADGSGEHKAKKVRK